MNWNFDHLRLLCALNLAVGAVAVYGPLAVVGGHPHMLPWIASLFFMIGWLIGPFFGD